LLSVVYTGSGLLFRQGIIVGKCGLQGLWSTLQVEGGGKRKGGHSEKNASTEF